MRLKEEILRGDAIGSARSIYSNNAILDAAPIDSLFERSLSSVIKFSPGLAKLPIDKKKSLRIVGELAFSYRVNDANRKQAKAHKRADKFFKKLQIELANWLEIDSTKTALVYGKPE